MSAYTTIAREGDVLVRDKIFINGEWVDSTGRGTIEVVNPATEEVIATVPEGTVEDVDRAVAAAVAALPAWSESTVEARKVILGRMADLLEERREEVTRLIVSEVGQALPAAYGVQTDAAISDLRIMVEVLDEIVWSEKVGGATVLRVPAGVVGAITPWNAPLRMVEMKAGAAIAAGCTVVLKSTEVAPLSSFVFAEVAQAAGLPAGVFNLVCGTGPVVGEAIAAHPDVDVISLTGSVRAGQRVMEVASPTVKGMSLELGGKSANVILDDADLERAITVGIEDAFRNSGQVCGGLSRVLVPRSHLSEAEKIAAQVAESYVVGDPLATGTALGPVTNRSQRDRVRSYIQTGIDEGATLLTGGPEAPKGLDRGFYVRPTVFSGTNEMRIAQEEIFGPVIVIVPFEDDEDAVRLANDTQYGLAGAVWSADPERARAVARRIRTGRIRINGAPLDPRAPHGGFKLSGVGREWGRFGIEEFLAFQSING